jgi:hypothetical protein
MEGLAPYDEKGKQWNGLQFAGSVIIFRRNEVITSLKI